MSKTNYVKCDLPGEGPVEWEMDEDPQALHIDDLNEIIDDKNRQLSICHQKLQQRWDKIQEQKRALRRLKGEVIRLSAERDVLKAIIERAIRTTPPPEAEA